MQRVIWAAGALALLTGLLIRFPAATHAAGEISVRVVSSRPDMVSGGDALVEITGVRSTSGPPALTVTLNARDVTTVFRTSPSGESLLGRIDGLVVGKNSLEVRAAGKRVAGSELQNHSITGPIFSGPHQTPFICQTE